MNEIGKILIFMGLILVVVGAVLLLFGKVLPLGKLPGDIYIKKDNFTVYIPITSVILLSVLLTLLLNLIFFLLRR
ncbi:DUF2905 domain-containing protein [Aquifex sp.]